MTTHPYAATETMHSAMMKIQKIVLESSTQHRRICS